MKINDVTSVGKTSSVAKKKSRASDGAAFDSMIGSSDEVAEESSISALAGISSMDALIAAQTINTSLSQKDKQVKKGNDILDYLEKLRVGMLSGETSPVIVSNIINEIKNVNTSEDEALDNIISEIELRAEVEIAKLIKQQ